MNCASEDLVAFQSSIRASQQHVARRRAIYNGRSVDQQCTECSTEVNIGGCFESNLRSRFLLFAVSDTRYCYANFSDLPRLYCCFNHNHT